MAKAQYNADSITVLEGLEAVRKRPGMYIGGVGSKGLNHLIYEIVDNAVDEHLAGFCTQITVRLEKDGSCTVRLDHLLSKEMSRGFIYCLVFKSRKLEENKIFPVAMRLGDTPVPIPNTMVKT